MSSKGLHGSPIAGPGCFPSGRYSPPPYRPAPDPMAPPPRRCMPNPTVSWMLLLFFGGCLGIHGGVMVSSFGGMAS